ncbi:DUF2273 domain-containing protein [Streptococcus porcinus]|uniref:DUF2273 domain-containing protein n=2 Tax=Streptococcus porcinus TaxID=1340 RepID=A0A4V0H5X1_STRPO|nr:DUF2273 domain-containing protein [Streptococcus porcinus]EGJ27123.1 hypothetical protein STRPO_0332 [Streptococcus porcinus str. Jelinkova 176]MBA2796522.1 DUF2273 domain-containing protein [Streptococcus porcinus]SQG44066.1 membrane protein [Streptococcus porcinus]VTS25274.1 membrane protein [Streptococcus porcinus]VTT43408.1 membrane protein [Streptococcus porcinus]
MEFFEKYKYPIVGGVIGLILAILLMTFGFFKTLLALIFIVLGVYGGLFVKRTGIFDQFIGRR